MKLLHLADLHLGKRVHDVPMLEDQHYILREIWKLAEQEQPDAVLLAGDIYDKPVPPAEAVTLFDEFLSGLARRKIPTLIISGNHDSPERVAFGGRLMAGEGIHLSPVYDGQVEPVVLRDEYGQVYFWLLPFLKPSQVRRFFPERQIESYTEAMEAAVSRMQLDPAARHVLVTHQFVTGSRRSESEELSVGGSDNVDAAVFQAFDYVALGHLHRPQNCGSERVRYSGSPLPYSFSEAGDRKSVTVALLGKKGELSLRTVPLVPLRELAELRGSYEELTRKSFYEGKGWQEAYTHITLTDEEDIPDAAAKLRVIYPNLLKLDYDNARTRETQIVEGAVAAEEKSPLALFGELYELQNNRPMSPEQETLIRGMIETIEEERA